MANTLSNLRKRFPLRVPEVSVDHLVIGGGVIGLAIGQELVKKFKRKSTFVLERHDQAGQETSSRNSEVIHAGIYYPQNSLKTMLCVRGRKLLYDHCKQHRIPHRKIGKLIISRSDDQTKYLEQMYAKCQSLNSDPHFRKSIGINYQDDIEDLMPLKILKGNEALELEPNLHQGLHTCLFSPETGIIDSHAYIQSLENIIDQSENGEIVYGTNVVRIDESPPRNGWIVQSQTNQGECSSVLAKCVINCAGLNAHNIYNQILYPEKLRFQSSFCKGNYYAYSSRVGVESVGHLIYPTPTTKPNQPSSFSGLGTHLTLDMNQKIKFGPDVEWLETKNYEMKKMREDDKISWDIEEEQDFWMDRLKPNDERIEMVYESVKSYLPGVEIYHFVPDYSGIRPKLRGLDEKTNEMNIKVMNNNNNNVTNSNDDDDRMRGNLNDFYIKQTDYGFINLLGIESPGLTSSLSISEYVVRELISLNFWKLNQKEEDDDNNNTRVCELIDRNNRFSEIGNLDSWS